MTSSEGWLPPGWTEESMHDKTEEEWDALTEEQYARITAHQQIVSEFQQAVNLGHAEALDAQRGHKALPDFLHGTNARGGSGIEANIAQVMHEKGLEEFGFVIFRVHDDPEADTKQWDLLKQKWASLAIDGREDVGSGNERSGVDEYGHPWPTWKWVDQGVQDLQDLDLGEITRHFTQLQEAGDIPDGLDHGMALAIDSEALASFDETDKVSDDDADDDVYTGPWVYAVDLTFSSNGDEDEDDEDEEPEIKGYFKVAVGSLLTDLWPFLAGEALPPDELEAMTDEAGVWRGVL